MCTAGADYPMLTGNLVAIFSSGIICTIVSLIKPDNYDWQTTREIPMVDDSETGALALPRTSPCGTPMCSHARDFLYCRVLLLPRCLKPRKLCTATCSILSHASMGMLQFGLLVSLSLLLPPWQSYPVPEIMQFSIWLRPDLACVLTSGTS